MTDINLIPETVLLAQTRQRHLARWVVSVMVSAAVVMVTLGWEWLQQAEAGDLQALNAQLQVDLERARAELRSVAEKANRVHLQSERAKALRAKRAWSGMIGLVGRCLPEPCWLTSIATDPAQPKGGVTRTSSRKGRNQPDEPQGPITIDAPRKLRLRGYAPEVAQPHALVSALKDTRVFSNVRLIRAEREPILDGSYYRFELVCEW